MNGIASYRFHREGIKVKSAEIVQVNQKLPSTRTPAGPPTATCSPTQIWLSCHPPTCMSEFWQQEENPKPGGSSSPPSHGQRSASLLHRPPLGAKTDAVLMETQAVSQKGGTGEPDRLSEPAAVKCVGFPEGIRTLVKTFVLRDC